MRTNTASQTAQIMALYRAMENSRPAARRLFRDPWACRFLEGRYRWASRLSRWPVTERWLYRYMQRRIPGALASGLARTKFIDDILEETIRLGAEQVIILGAGYDTRSLRLDFLKEIPVIEIDHPDTSRRKLQALGYAAADRAHSTTAAHATGPAVVPASTAAMNQATVPVTAPANSAVTRANTRYWQADLNQQDTGDFLQEQGVDFSIPTTILWEGVTNYLERSAVDRMFEIAARFAPGSFIIFTYIDQLVLDHPEHFLGGPRLLQDLEDIEERWTCGLEPARLRSYLRSFQWELEQDQDAATYRQRYLPERPGILQGYEFYRVAWASRAPDSRPA